MSEKDAYELGRAAFRFGKRDIDNPYPAASRGAILWSCGRNEAERDFNRRMRKIGHMGDGA